MSLSNISPLNVPIECPTHHLPVRYLCLRPDCSNNVKLLCVDCRAFSPHGHSYDFIQDKLIKMKLLHTKILQQQNLMPQDPIKAQKESFISTIESTFSAVRTKINECLSQVQDAWTRAVQKQMDALKEPTTNFYNDQLQLLDRILKSPQKQLFEVVKNTSYLSILKELMDLEPNEIISPNNQQLSSSQLLCPLQPGLGGGIAAPTTNPLTPQQIEIQELLGHHLGYKLEDLNTQVSNFIQQGLQHLKAFGFKPPIIQERFDANTFKGVENQILNPGGCVNSLITLDYTHFASAEHTGIINIWELGKQKPISNMKHPSNAYALIKIEQDLIASGSFVGEYTVKVWNWLTGNCLSTLIGHTGAIYTLLRISSDKIFSAGYDNSIRVWNWRDKKLLQHISGAHDDIINASLLFNDDRIATASTDQSIKIWRDWQCVRQQEFDASQNSLLKINEEVFASGAQDGKIRIMKNYDMELIVILDAHPSNCIYKMIKIDERIIVSGSSDKSVKIWLWKDEKCLKILKGNSIIQCGLDIIGKKIISGGDFENQIILWQ